MDEVTTHKKSPVDNIKKTVMPPKDKNRPTYKETKIVYVIAATLLPLLLLSTIYFVVTLHQLSVRLSEVSDYVGTIEIKTASLENRQKEFHGQLSHLNGKFTEFSNSPLLKEVETLTPRVNLLEKQLESIHVRKKLTLSVQRER
jgi:chaperonin cofactor prefoldin